MSELSPGTSLAVAQSGEVPDALARCRAGTLVDLYDGWRGLLLARAAAAAARAREDEALTVRAGMVLRSVENACELSRAPTDQAESGLSAADSLSGYIAESQRELSAARGALTQRAQDEERFFAEELSAVKERIAALARTLASRHRPRVEVQVQPVGKDRSLVHLARPEPQDLVLLAFQLSGRLFTRYEAFSDDSVDELGLEPARFYADEGNARTRFEKVEDEEALLDAPDRIFVPLKGMIAFRIPGHEFPRFRLINRGPVMEACARVAGGAYLNLMSREAAELLSGFLIKLKIDGRIDLVLRVG